MADFAMILCSENEDVIKEKPLNSITYKIRSIFKGREIQIKVNKVELYKDLNMYIIKIQNTIENLLLIKQKQLNDILRSVSDICMKNNIRDCIIPESLPDKFQSIGCIKKKFSGQYLYMSILQNILNDLLSGNKNSIDELEIAVINGDSEERLFTIIHLLMPKIKYLTIITEDKEFLENNINRICSETGLSIRLTSDIKNTLKDIDLIINLNSSITFKEIHKLKPSTVMINYAEPITSWASVENVIINKIDIGIPTVLKNKMDSNYIKSFTSLEFSEIILSHKLNIEDDILGDHYNCDNMQILANAFKQCGFRIEGFFGRRGLVKKIV
jgi:hypothetical protein